MRNTVVFIAIVACLAAAVTAQFTTTEASVTVGTISPSPTTEDSSVASGPAAEEVSAAAIAASGIPNTCIGQECKAVPRAVCYVCPRDFSIIWVNNGRVVDCSAGVESDSELIILEESVESTGTTDASASASVTIGG